MKTFRSNGKLLLTSEYVVLDGAKALALPTKYGQSLCVEANNNNTINWKSYDEKGNIWFEDIFDLSDNEILRQDQNDNAISNRLVQILEAAKSLNSKFLNSNQGYTITTHQDFNRKWGLGTSSTLINNISNWANVDAYKLLNLTFGGSGYDIACAQHDTPISYQLIDSEKPVVETTIFNPSYKDYLYFVYLNQKQNSREGIKTYKTLGKANSIIIDKFNILTESVITCTSLSKFEALITEHELLLSKRIQQEPVKSKLFNDFDGSIKSLGAWGGDFILATSMNNPTGYFKNKGFETVIPYKDMVLN